MKKTTPATLPMTNELVSVLLAKKCADDHALLAAVRENPRKALEVRNDVANVRTVQNTPAVLHVCVPDYEALRACGERELTQVSGGISEPHQLGADDWHRSRSSYYTGASYPMPTAVVPSTGS